MASLTVLGRRAGTWQVHSRNGGLPWAARKEGRVYIGTLGKYRGDSCLGTGNSHSGFDSHSHATLGPSG